MRNVNIKDNEVVTVRHDKKNIIIKIAVVNGEILVSMENGNYGYRFGRDTRYKIEDIENENRYQWLCFAES